MWITYLIITSQIMPETPYFSLLKNPLPALKKMQLVPVFLLFFYCGQAQHADINLLDRINNTDVTSGTFKSMRLVSNTTGLVTLGIPVVSFVTGMIGHDVNMKKKAIYMVESMAVAQVAAISLKAAVNRPRPFITYPHPRITRKVHVGSLSFPSGHTSLAFANATSLSIAYPRWYVIVPSYTYAGLVGYSRMYLGVHYPTDVLAGAVLGSGSAWVTYSVNKWLNRTRHRKLSTTW